MKIESGQRGDTPAAKPIQFIHSGLTPEEIASDPGVSDEDIGAYGRDVVALLRCTNEEAVVIEDLMRNEVFHSTLDWLSKQQFNRGARKAKALLAGDREFFLQAYAERRALFRKARRQRDTVAQVPAYEI
jgi:hypothetical protein